MRINTMIEAGRVIEDCSAKEVLKHFYSGKFSMYSEYAKKTLKEHVKADNRLSCGEQKELIEQIEKGEISQFIEYFYEYTYIEEVIQTIAEEIPDAFLQVEFTSDLRFTVCELKWLSVLGKDQVPITRSLTVFVDNPEEVQDYLDRSKIKKYISIEWNEAIDRAPELLVYINEQAHLWDVLDKLRAKHFINDREFKHAYFWDVNLIVFCE